MKRSEINSIMREAIKFIEQSKFPLPPFALWTPEEWKHKGHEFDEIRDVMLGWDITDFGSGDYDSIGLLMITLRNGKLNDLEYDKPYAEKLLICLENQVTPYHFHYNKMEDIINRGGATLVVKLYNSSDNGEMLDSDVVIYMDGRKFVVKAGEQVRVQPGQSITIPTGVYHSFWAENGKLLLGEVSKVNDDRVDNRFYQPVGRFPVIEEDEAPIHLLGNEYPVSSQQAFITKFNCKAG